MKPAARLVPGIPGLFSLCIAFAIVFTTARADADSAEADAATSPAPLAAPPVPRDSPVQLHLDAAAGVTTAGVLVSALGLVRFGVLELGGSYSSSGLFSTRTGGGVALGGGVHRPGGGGWDVLGELGVNQHHVSGGLLTSDPGATASIPYGGLRAGVDWSIGRADAAVHPTLGLWLFARVDLAQQGASYTYQNSSWFGDSSQTRNGSAKLGGGGEIGIALAGGLDLLP
ncbi:MAG: hypothetical protein JWO86_2370 [Myxococcaceae bacterium]|nr:hypothetical protein [Myxococcaceae bacterium]